MAIPRLDDIHLSRLAQNHLIDLDSQLNGQLCEKWRLILRLRRTSSVLAVDGDAAFPYLNGSFTLGSSNQGLESPSMVAVEVTVEIDG